MFGRKVKKIIITFITSNGNDKTITYSRRKFKEQFGMKEPTDGILVEYCENILNQFPNIIDYEIRKE